MIFIIRIKVSVFNTENTWLYDCSKEADDKEDTSQPKILDKISMTVPINLSWTAVMKNSKASIITEHPTTYPKTFFASFIWCSFSSVSR